MKIYWTAKSVPELADLSPSDRGRVHRACYGQALKSRRCKVALLISGLCAGLGGIVGNSLHWLFGFPPSIWHMAVGGVIGGGIGGFVYGQVVTDYLRPFYADYIKTELRRTVP
jgi:hypothetical protein